MTTYSIQQLAAEFGVSQRALRFYEEKKLLSPLRRGMDRIYTQKDRSALKFILHARNAGFALGEIYDILDFVRNCTSVEEQYRFAIEAIQDRMSALNAQRSIMEKQLGRLEKTCRRFQRKLAQASASDFPNASSASDIRRVG